MSVDDLRLAAEFGYLDQLMLPPDAAVAHLPSVVVSGERAMDMRHGRQWRATGGVAGQRARVYSEDGQFVGLAELRGEDWQPKMVMLEED